MNLGVNVADYYPLVQAIGHGKKSYQEGTEWSRLRCVGMGIPKHIEKQNNNNIKITTSVFAPSILNFFSSRDISNVGCAVQDLAAKKACTTFGRDRSGSVHGQVIIKSI